ncbi:MAG: hypothetical protein DI582_07770 [Azospirillum brasilense]|nr:MAG: hypothetical protein DI582_07770 [Azospirillum brasilense]
MNPATNSLGPAPSIAIAEGASTLVSMGSIWLMQHHPGPLRGLTNYVQDTAIYPGMAKKTPPQNAEQEAALKAAAHTRASLLVKGATMVATGFAAHVPIQMALEGRFDRHGLKTAVFGKSAGLAISLGSIAVVNRVAPSALPALQNAIFPLVKPFLPKDERGRDSRQAEEVAKLLILDLPSSAVAGLINYATTKHAR